MSGTDAEARVRRFWRAFLASEAEGEGALEGIVTPGVRFRGSLGIAVTGAEGIVGYCRRARRVFQDFDVVVVEVAAEGTQAAARLRFTGVHREALFGIEASGRPIEYDGMAWMRHEGDRFSDIWVMGDAAEWMAWFNDLPR
jgi:predicted ester cyclase